MVTVRRHPDHDYRGSQRHRARVAWVCRPGAVLAWDGDRGSTANPASCDSCSRTSTGCPCVIRTATRLVPTLWASLPGADDLLAIRSLTDWSGR